MSIRIGALEEQLRAKNSVYDSTDSVIWRLGVYEPVHDGWRFSNIGGRTVLDAIGRAAHLNRQAVALEIGSGLGDAARYLAEQFGCAVIGVDMNDTQFGHARRMAAACGLAHRLEFLHGSIEDERTRDELRRRLPPAGVALVYTLDVLMLTANPGSILRHARTCLRPEGWLALAEVTSGPAATDDLRSRLWEMDGMRSLLTPGEYAALLVDADCLEVHVTDRTTLAVDCFRKMAAAFVEKRSEIVHTAPVAEYEGWRRITDLYLDFFRRGNLLYTQVLGR